MSIEFEFDSNKRLICDNCFRWVEPDEPKIIIGRMSDDGEVNYIEVYHRDCANYATNRSRHN
jgi:hypothetical protein